MYPAFDEFQKKRKYSPNERRLSPSRPALAAKEQGQEGNATNNE